ncbi:phage portal protein [Nocardioides sp.]|uniref:phage portal protein n=1 Tax=Nocardioides sp. TaxID=35761 RepID=UPI00262A5A67|nr:phage portal protein [Nocardioides sp.]
MTGFWRSVFNGRPDPIITAAIATTEAPTAFAVDADSVPPEVFGLTSYASTTAPVARVSRREAAQVPAVKRSRDLIAGSLGTLPLVTVKPDLSVDRTSWLTQPERDIPRSVTMTRLVEDLLYEGVAWWKITSFAWDGYPANVVRLDPRSVDVLKDGRIHVTGDGHRGMADEWPTDAELIRFDSPNDALLVAGARAIRQCLILDAAAQRYAEGAPPLDYFTPADDGLELNTDEVTGILDNWNAARHARATGYVPAALKYNLGGWNPEQLQLAAQRDHAVLEIARVAGVDAEELSVSTTSRTYANVYDRRRQFLDFTLGGYRAAIEDRLSMGDVTPNGTTTRFDLDAFLRTDALSRWSAAKVGIEVGAITPEEVREGEGRPALDAPPETTTSPTEEPMPEPNPIEVTA